METIKKMYENLLPKNKSLVIEVLAQEYGISQSSVRANWFSKWTYPEHAEARIHEVILNMLKLQIEANTKATLK